MQEKLAISKKICHAQLKGTNVKSYEKIPNDISVFSSWHYSIVWLRISALKCDTDESSKKSFLLKKTFQSPLSLRPLNF